MSQLLSWFRRPGKDSQSVELAKDSSSLGSLSTQADPAEESTILKSVDVHTSEADPKVEEFFKHFPEPYREKAIQRFSKREGWLKYDFIRDHAMHTEMLNAMQGRFLEDKREFEVERERENQKRYEEEIARLKSEQKDRIAPAWEQKLLQYVPLEEDETMGWKLFNTANLMALGAALAWQGRQFRRSNPRVERWKLYTHMTGALGLCCLCQVAAYCRLMNVGPFDRSNDKRDAVTKLMDDAKGDFENVMKYIDKNIGK